MAVVAEIESQQRSRGPPEGGQERLYARGN